MSVIDRRRWRHGGVPSELEGLDEALDLAELDAQRAAGDAAHAAAQLRRRAEVLRLCGLFRRYAHGVLVTASDLEPAKLITCVGDRGMCPSLEAVAQCIDHCREIYDELQLTLGLRDDEPPRFGTRSH